MGVSVEIPYYLDMCVKGVCTPLKIPINSDFKIHSLEVDTSTSPLSKACKIKIHFGNEIVYNGMMGSGGFILTVVDIDAGADFEVSLHTDCSLLVDLTEEIDSIKVIVKGEIHEGVLSFSDAINEEWA